LKIDAWLAELKIPRENYRLVMMLPMVYVAWADGRIQAAERKLILQIAAIAACSRRAGGKHSSNG